MTSSISESSNSGMTSFNPKENVNPYADLLENCLKSPNNITSINDVPALIFLKGQINERIEQFGETQAISDLYQQITDLKLQVNNQLISIEKKQMNEQNDRVSNIIQKISILIKTNQYDSNILSQWIKIIQDECSVKTIVQEDMIPVIETKRERLKEVELVISLALSALTKESENGIKDTKRPQAVETMIQQLKMVDLEKMNDYINAGVRVASFKTLTDQPTIISDEITRNISKGGQGVVNESPSKTFIEEKGQRRIQHFRIAVKTDIAKGTTEQEYRAFKKLWDQLNPEERKYFVGLIGITSGKKTTESLEEFEGLQLERFDLNLAHGLDLLPPGAKLEIVDDVLKSLEILFDHGFILSDIKIQNMLYKKINNHYKGALSDYGDLIDFNEILRNPTPENLEELYYKLDHWTPNDLPIGEHVKILRDVEINIQHVVYYQNLLTQDFSQMSPSEFSKFSEQLFQALDILMQNLHTVHGNIKRLMSFATAASLYRFLTKEPAYTQMKANAFRECPDHIQNYACLYFNPTIDYSTKQHQKLLDSGCSPEQTRKIMQGLKTDGMTQSIPMVDPSLSDQLVNFYEQINNLLNQGLVPIILEDNLDVANLIDLKEIIRNPSSDLIYDLLVTIDSYDLKNINIVEYFELKTMVEQFCDNFNQLNDDQKMNAIQKITVSLIFLQRFNLGSTLFRILTTQSPYHTVSVDRFGENVLSQHIIGAHDYPTRQQQLLEHVNCPKHLIEIIMRFINPIPEYRS